MVATFMRRAAAYVFRALQQYLVTKGKSAPLPFLLLSHCDVQSTPQRTLLPRTRNGREARGSEAGRGGAGDPRESQSQLGGVETRKGIGGVPASSACSPAAPSPPSASWYTSLCTVSTPTSLSRSPHCIDRGLAPVSLHPLPQCPPSPPLASPPPCPSDSPLHPTPR